MSEIAIVGSAEVVIRAIGNSLERDIQAAFDRASRGARASGRNAGDQFGQGAAEGVAKHDIAGNITPSNNAVDRAGSSVGGRLGEAMGRGFAKSRLRSTIIKSLLKLAVIIPVIGTLVGGISTLISGLFALVAAAGTASAALIVFPGILAAIAQGAVVTAIGFQGVGEAISAGFDPSKAKQFQEAMAKLPPSARAFVTEFVKLKDTFRGVQAAAAEGLFEGPNSLIVGLGKVAPFLERIAGAFRATAQAVATGVNSIIDRLTTGNALTNFAVNAATSNIVIRDLGKTFGNLGAAILATLGAAAPIIREFSGWLVEFSQGLRESTEAGTGSTLSAYFFEAAEVAKIFIAVVKNLFVGLFRLGQVAQPFGVDLLNSLREASKAFANLTNDPAKVESLQNGFAGISDNLKAIGELAKAVGAAFLRMGADPSVGRIADALRNAVPEFEALLNAANRAGPAIVNFVAGLAGLVAAFLDMTAVEVVIGIFAAFLDVLGGVARALGPFLGPILSTLAVFKVFGVAARLANVAVGILIRSIVGLRVAFMALPVIGQIAAILTLLAFAFKYAWEHSQTFRNVVVAALKGVVSYFQLILRGWQFVLSALGKVPGFGWAKTAANAIGNFNTKLEGAKTKLDELAKKKPNVKIGADTNPARQQINNVIRDASDLRIHVQVTADIQDVVNKLNAIAGAFKSDKGIAGAFSKMAGNTAAGLAQVVTARRAVANKFLATGSSSGGLGSSGGGGGGGTGGESKEEKEKKEPKEIDMSPIFESIRESGEKFRDAMQSFVKELHDAGESGSAKIAQGFLKRLRPMTFQLDTLVENIEKFNERAKQVTESLISRANIFANLSEDKGNDFGTIRKELQKFSKDTQDFANTINQLRVLGLDDTLIGQFADAGPEALDRARAIVKSGTTGVQQLNALAQQIKSFSAVAGKEAAAALLKAGATQADGFLQGLIAQRDGIQKEFTKAATKMGNKIAETLSENSTLVNLLTGQGKKIAKNADGTRNFAGGFSLVGERGPELVYLPKGSDVYTAQDTRSMLAGTRTVPEPQSGDNIVINQIYQGPTTGSDRKREIDWTLRYASRFGSSNGGI